MRPHWVSTRRGAASRRVASQLQRSLSTTCCGLGRCVDRIAWGSRSALARFNCGPAPMHGSGAEIHPELGDSYAIPGGVGYQTFADTGNTAGWNASAPQPPPTRPAPLPKRPNGRLFVGAILVALCAFAVYSAWDAFF